MALLTAAMTWHRCPGRRRRRPFKEQPRAFAIDRVLSRLLPDLYPKVRIE